MHKNLKSELFVFKTRSQNKAKEQKNHQTVQWDVMKNVSLEPDRGLVINCHINIPT